MIRLGEVEAAIEEAERFLRKAKVVRDKTAAKARGSGLPLPERGGIELLGPALDVSACRRASLDLTRALADLRRRG